MQSSGEPERVGYLQTNGNRGARASLSDRHNSFVGFVLRAGASGLSRIRLIIDRVLRAKACFPGAHLARSVRSSGEPERLGYRQPAMQTAQGHNSFAGFFFAGRSVWVTW